MDSSEERLKLVSGFDYEVLDAQQRLVVQQRTGEIRESLRRSAQEIWEIGQKLADVRLRLKHGQFEAWLKGEFGWSRRTAYNFINVYEAFGERANLAQIEIATSALYLLAAPSTPQEVRSEVLQRAKEGETVTHKELRQVIKEEKLLSPPAVETPEPPKQFAPKPEIVVLRPKAVVEAEKSALDIREKEPSGFDSLIMPGKESTTTVSPGNDGALSNDFVSTPKLFSTSVPVAIPYKIQPGWYLLARQHLLFCGDTASAKFVERTTPAALAIAITSDDWDHDWLVERAKTVVVFPESNLKEQLIEQLIVTFTTPGEVIIFPWLPDEDMIAVAHKLERLIFAGDQNPERCSRAIARSRLSAEQVN